MNRATLWFADTDAVETFEGDLDCGVLDGTIVIREVSGKVDKTMTTHIVPLYQVERVKFEQNIKEDSDEAAGIEVV